MIGKLVKISRYAEAFWVRDVREFEPGLFVGVVDNELSPSNPYKLGDLVPFVEREVREVMDHPKPALSVVP
jgi:hypothetical protein